MSDIISAAKERFGDLDLVKIDSTSPMFTFESTYPVIAKEFKKIQEEQYKLFAKKMLDYGLGNVNLGGNMDNAEDKKYSILGIQIRLNDKINRLKNLLKNNINYVKNESIEDTFIDISNYGIIALLLQRDKWK